MKSEVIQSVLLLCFAIGVFVASQVKKHESATHVVKVWASNCAFPAPEEFRNGPYSKSLVWCEESDRQPLVNLMNHMRIHSAEMDASIAPEFGVNIKVGFLIDADVFIINPRLVPRSESEWMIECMDSVGGEVVSKMRPQAVEIEFISQAFKKTTQRFVNRDSCLVQLMLETL